MQEGLDRRLWLETDRPLERLAVGRPLPGLTVMSVRESDRQWTDYHTDFRLCLIDPSRLGVGASYTCRRGTHRAGAGDLMTFEPGDHHVTTRVSGGRASFHVIGIDPEQFQAAAAESGLRGQFHFRSSQMQNVEVAHCLAQLTASVAACA